MNLQGEHRLSDGSFRLDGSGKGSESVIESLN
jgi:hypothetical protein